MAHDIEDVVLQSLRNCNVTPRWVLDDRLFTNESEFYRSFTADTLSHSYLEFLQVQIELNARGKEWTAILKHRLAALEPFVGTELYEISARMNDCSYFAKIDPSTGEVVYSETL